MARPFGVNAKVMDDLGLTVLKRDADGNITKEIDWIRPLLSPRGPAISISISKAATRMASLIQKISIKSSRISSTNSMRTVTPRPAAA